jgi:hypothetical protein
MFGAAASRGVAVTGIGTGRGVGADEASPAVASALCHYKGMTGVWVFTNRL